MPKKTKKIVDDDEDDRNSAMDVDDVDDVDDLDDDEVNDELELPLELAGLNAKEKRNLLRFKRSHNQVEYEEEIVRRTANLARSTDYERLKKMSQSKDSAKTASASKKKPPTSAVKRTKAALIPQSDDEEEEDEEDEESSEEEAPKRKTRGKATTPKGKAAAPAKSKSKGGRRKIVESESEEEEEEEEEEDDKEADEPADDAEEGEEEEEEEEEESEDDLFDSDEEEEITKRGRTTSKADDSDADGGKKKKLRKGGTRKSTRKSSAWDDEEDEEEDEDDENDEDDEDDEDAGRGKKRGGRILDDNKYQEDGDLRRIKRAYRTNRQEEAELQSKDKQAPKAVVFQTLEDYKRHLLQKGLAERDSGKGYIKETPVPAADDDKDLAEYPDYLQIFLRREDIARVLQEPFFDDYIEGCFVRYLMEAPGGKAVYRACQIVEVGRTERGYKINTGKGDMDTKVVLKLNSQGVTVDRKRLDKISNHTLTEDEVSKHITGLVERQIQPLTKREIRVKHQRLRDYTRSYVYSNEEVQSMIAQRTGLNQVFATDYTTALAELQKTLVKATQERNFDLMEVTQKEIEKLTYENERQKKVYEKTYKVHADVNRKMREMNTKRDMEAGMRKRREDQEAAAKGILSHSVTDPFVRRETRPKNLWMTTSHRPPPKPEDGTTQSTATAASTTADSTTDAAASTTATKKATHEKRFGAQDDTWPIPLVVDIEQMRKRFKRRHGVDPLENVNLDKQARHLKKVMVRIPPKGTAEREQLRGGNRSLQEYLEQLHAEEAA